MIQQLVLESLRFCVLSRRLFLRFTKQPCICFVIFFHIHSLSFSLIFFADMTTKKVKKPPTTPAELLDYNMITPIPPTWIMRGSHRHSINT